MRMGRAYDKELQICLGFTLPEPLSCEKPQITGLFANFVLGEGA